MTELTRNKQSRPEEERSSRNAALLVATLVSFLTPFMGSAVNIALPVMGTYFSMNAVLLSWVATAYLLAAAMFLVPFGKIADIHGRKKIFTYGIMIYTFSSFLCGIAPSAVSLILFRVIQGIGSAMIFGTAIAILTSVFAPHERGRVLGINVSAVYIGLSVGPFIGGILTEQLGWRSVFLINVPLGAIIIATVAWKLKGEWAGARGEKLDYLGSLIYGISLLFLTYGLSRLPGFLGATLIGAGVVGIIIFVLYELKVENPVVNMNLFRQNTVFAFSNLAALINYSATFALGFLLSLYLQHIKGYGPQAAGLILVAQPVMMALFSPFAGRLSDRVEPRVVATTGMAITTLGLVILSFIDEETSLFLIVTVLMILGFGFALFSSPNTNAIMGSVVKKYYGVASAMVGTMRLVGQVFSMGVAMLIFALIMGTVQISPEIHVPLVRSIAICFIIFSILCFMGVFASLARGRLRHPPAEVKERSPRQ
ncbi:MFS transporter [candidate division CSSED10-310 bacterium]|uniref:MFS transporter n=1 Tax=candidate division CSSED10-310 bacterium TaxID=2855610 RepID=A0ABV6YS82_UNCC1